MNARDKAIHAFASAQKNLITLAQVVQAGGTAALAYREVERGRWTTIHRGVWLIGHADPTWEQRALAACLAAGPGARISHSAAAVLHELDGAELGPIEITIPYSRNAELKSVTVHRSVRELPFKIEELHGIPVVSIVETLIGYAASGVGLIKVEQAVEDAIRRGLVSDTYLARQLAIHGGPGWRGSGVLRRVLAERLGGGPAGSYLEILAAHVLRDHGMQGWERQVEVRTPSGKKRKIDLGRRDVMLGIELKGKRGHSTKTEVARDAAREAELEALGWTLPCFSYDDVVDRPRQFAADVRRYLEACGPSAAL